MLKENPCLNNLKKYISGKAIQEKKLIKLNANENPYGINLDSKSISNLLQKCNHYPSLSTSTLKKSIAALHNINQNQISVTNGSDEVLALINLAYLNEKSVVITSQNTFSQYEFMANLANAKLKTVSLKKDYQQNLDEILIEANKHQESCCCIASPNNPTGIAINPKDLKSFLDRYPRNSAVILDQAYEEYNEKNQETKPHELLSNYRNLIIMRTFSKAYGLAGFRIGYALSSPKIIENLEKVKQPFNVNKPAIAAAIQQLEDINFIKKTRKLNNIQKIKIEEFFKKNHISYLKSDANFHYIDLKKCAKTFCEKMEENGVLVRDLSHFGFKSCIRVSIGTEEENIKFMEAFLKCKN